MKISPLAAMVLLGSFLFDCSKSNDLTAPPKCYLSSVTVSGSNYTNTGAFLTYNASNRLVNASGQDIIYDKKGRMVKIEGNITVGYNSDSTLITSNSLGYVFTYNSSNQLTLCQFNGLTLSFGYASTQSNNPTSENFGMTTSFYDYDNKLNPLTATFSSPALYFLFYPYAINHIFNPNVPMLFGTNNVTKVTTALASIGIDIFNISYTYNSKGYPLTAVMVHTLNGVSQGGPSTFTFTYTNCQ